MADSGIGGHAVDIPGMIELTWTIPSGHTGPKFHTNKSPTHRHPRYVSYRTRIEHIELNSKQFRMDTYLPNVTAFHALQAKQTNSITHLSDKSFRTTDTYTNPTFEAYPI